MICSEHVRDKSTFKDSPTNDAISKSATSHYTSVVKMPNTPLASVVKYTLMPKTARENLP